MIGITPLPATVIPSAPDFYTIRGVRRAKRSTENYADWTAFFAHWTADDLKVDDLILTAILAWSITVYMDHSGETSGETARAKVFPITPLHRVYQDMDVNIRCPDGQITSVMAA